ncbi:hypothetical protein RI129_012162 [Pyrocoelia pectoralis]|uniref:CTCHY-type domain-containing protein n=1 Tax=Pyrocoelia pectoralis TaxID=417401 RepID=A0AAN7UYM0_9COLE
MEEDHVLEKYMITQVKCFFCDNVQTVKDTCDNCGIAFALYSCISCLVWDSNPKGHFHCDECNLCRIGGKENYFHCKKCHICFANRLKNNHKCIKNCGLGNCPLCGGRIHDSSMELHVPECGHLLHDKCYCMLLSNNIHSCIVCNSSFN